MSSPEETWSARFRVTCSCEYIPRCCGASRQFHVTYHMRVSMCACMRSLVPTPRQSPGGGGVFLVFRDFSRFFRETGLTKRGNGCNLYSAGSKKGRCSPQNGTALDRVSAETGLIRKKNRKIFRKWLDKVEKRATLNSTA